MAVYTLSRPTEGVYSVVNWELAISIWDELVYIKIKKLQKKYRRGDVMRKTL